MSVQRRAQELDNDVEETAWDLEEAFKEVYKERDAVNEGLDRLVTSVKFGINIPMDVITSQVERDLRWIRDLTRKAVTIVDVAEQHHVPVVALFQTASRWLKDVMSPMSDVYAQIPRSASYDLHKWEDAARAPYDEIQNEQYQAAGAVRDRAAFICEKLTEIAVYNVEYLTELAGMLVSFVTELTRAATMVAQLDLEGVAVALSAQLDAFYGVLDRIANGVANAVASVNDLRSVQHDHSYLPGGRWPQVRRA